MAETRRSSARQAKPRNAGGSAKRSAAAQKGTGRSQTQRSEGKRKTTKTTQARPTHAGQTGDGSSSRSGRSSSSRPESGGRNGLSASDVVVRARAALSELLGMPVEGVLGVDRDHGNWVATVQAVELARIPNTTDVLGEYEAVLDKDGELVRYHRTRRYTRGQVDGGGQ